MSAGAADPFSLAGKRILVTGASSGIGRQTAIACAQQGAQVIVTGRDTARLAATAEALAGEGHVQLVADLTVPEQLTALAEQCGAIDGVVHAAGISRLVPLRMLKQAHLDEMFGHNVYAPILLTKELLARRRLQAKGSIVFVSAVASHVGPLASSAYSASKAALLGCMRSLGLEVAKQGIRVNCIAPGYVRTPMLDGLATGGLNTDDYAALAPLGMGEPQDVALAAVFYLADASRWITRNYFVIDGGLTVPMDIYA
ncbi:SDR family oxidoreductase [uncultured Pseudacidovorax sp.]|uniref:SDR family NAD(P)-dependent oxidoreductase n=1 Tax=uncultured Pseudacidovorax sp. TaxID=679313 RepID=UPI0025CB8B5E|nr:SDR family oxidoreductase [uncultured Pseudacidovorax sp.]